MKRLALLASLLIALPLAAQAPKPPQPSPVPVVSDALKAQFFKAQSFMVQAETQAQKAEGIYQNAIAELNKACGESAVLQTDKNGDPVCVATPAPAKK